MKSAWWIGTIVVLGGGSRGQVTQRVSVNSLGQEGNFYTSDVSISGDGRYVAFVSAATNVVPGDTNDVEDVFLRDRQTGITERISVDSNGTEANSASHFRRAAVISGDGRYVVFASHADNLVPGDLNQTWDVFVRDRWNGTTTCVSVDPGGAPGNIESEDVSISEDGRFVVFSSEATNLVPGDTNGAQDVFVRDLQSATTELVSVDSNGVQGNGYSIYPSISADGRFVAFGSGASNLAAGDTNGVQDVYVRDRQNGTTVRASLDSNGNGGNDESILPSISADGVLVAFGSMATNLVAGDTNGDGDIFVRDLQAGTTERIDVSSSGAEADRASLVSMISADGRAVVFTSNATNLVPGMQSTNAFHAFVRDRQNATTELASVDWNGEQAHSGAESVTLSAEGRYVAFECFDALVPDDTNFHSDAYVRDRDFDWDSPSLCSPGLSGVRNCPCSNPPSSADRGCDNSEATGGASLSVSGAPYLSSDTLLFTADGERSQTLSILMQGTLSLPGGVAYGQGVRCVGGSLKRLFVGSASLGSVTYPKFQNQEPTVHARSAARGDSIQAGSTRWYLSFYRDPNVLGGCPATSTFNSTQTREVSWLP